jgi:hypothetical protein
MAKKIQHTFKANLWLNTEKGGAWIAEYHYGTEEDFKGLYTAWKNASAAKRWLKSVVQEVTPRKSIKMVAGDALNEKGKPVSFTGELKYNA